jgi:hypothetical protein
LVMAKNQKLVDIRPNIPEATKSGPVSKPIWTIGSDRYKFVRPVTKHGLDNKGHKVPLGKRVLAKYDAGRTTAGAVLWFVGVFAKVKTKGEQPAIEQASEPVQEPLPVPAVEAVEPAPAQEPVIEQPSPEAMAS